MTQISDAKKGILTDEMKHVAKIEGVSEDFILRSVANGTIVIRCRTQNKSKCNRRYFNRYR